MKKLTKIRLRELRNSVDGIEGTLDALLRYDSELQADDFQPVRKQLTNVKHSFQELFRKLNMRQHEAEERSNWKAGDIIQFEESYYGWVAPGVRNLTIEEAKERVRELPGNVWVHGVYGTVKCVKAILSPKTSDNTTGAVVVDCEIL